MEAEKWVELKDSKGFTDSLTYARMIPSKRSEPEVTRHRPGLAPVARIDKPQASHTLNMGEVMKHGTFTFGTTPEPVIRDAFADEDTGGFYWDLRGSDSRNAERLDLHRIDESKVEGFIKIIDRLADPGVYLRLEDDDVLWDWAPSLRADMLASIEIEEI